MHRGGDRSTDPSSGPAPGSRGGGDGRFGRGPSRWSSGGGGGGSGSPPHRFSRGGGGGGGDGGGGGGGGGRFHPYRGPSDHSGGGGYRSGGGGEYGEPGSGPRHRYGSGRGDHSDHDNRNNYVKLFIGSVPRTATEDDVRPLFEEHGDVVEVALIKDRKTGEQQGCCFVKYATSEEAERAIRALHNQYTLPGAMGPIQVRYADGERERHGAIEHKLFVASLNKQATAKEIEEIFAPYGHVEDVYIMKDGMRQSRGCGFVKFSSREPALAAMSALSGNYVMRGCEQPLIIRFADPKRPRPGESRGGPAFGGPGFSPRSDAALVIRPTANLDEPRGRHMPPDSWHPSSPRSAPHQFNNFGSDNPMAPKGSTVTSTTDTRKWLFVKPNSCAKFVTYGHEPSSHGTRPSSGRPADPTFAKATRAPSAVSNSMQAIPGQQHLPSNVAPQMLQQPVQQMPSQAPQLLLQQQAALQSSYQSSQQAIYQLQQQLQLMQQQQQSNLNHQQPTQGQPVQSSNPGAPNAIIPSNINTIPQQATSPAVPLTCNWTEHTSPEGFKYYYNSITRESKWDKPEEYVLYEQQQQQQQQQKLLLLQQHQQKLAMQQLQSPPQAQTHPAMQPVQQIPQAQQGQQQMQMKQQELNYTQLQTPGAIDPSRIQQVNDKLVSCYSEMSSTQPAASIKCLNGA
uniref:Flowering time control protein FCA n=1 Tax=Oryza nivara TaxID=4536 RepID=A0A0E0IGF5_ORYNI